ncbi:hypothetical protein AXG93_4620s1590 [Marchantia polymorpha subsp. ruderalis]|uniref:Uncharacterized protein n=1 Tax=Marchantia polymorpha subsp. ruderalis TaxID=1480154 RepID=A0A176VX05_MARPO|nr:hypothetical protein AXG93_4620s1590 [Marchantia polymorpha subsp. ruderalis]
MDAAGILIPFGISVEICVSRSSYPTADGARCLEKFRNLSGVGYGSSSVKRATHRTECASPYGIFDPSDEIR